jgi:hypothetical protein
VSESADEVAGRRDRSEHPQAGRGDPRSLDRDRDERAGGEAAWGHPPRQPERPGRHPGGPERHQQSVAALADVERLRREHDHRGRRGGHEQQRHEYDADREPQVGVAGEQHDAVARPPGRLALGGNAGAPRERDAGGRERQERAGVGEQRDLRAAARGEQPAQCRPELEAGVARRLDVPVGARERARACQQRHERELRGVRDRVHASQQRGQ